MRKAHTVITAILFITCNLYAGQPDLRLNTIVIDAGHGGKDAGTVSKDRKTYEKTLTLKISKKFAEKVTEAYPSMKVVLTRKEDLFVPLETRAAIASRNNANLFISIHINAAAKSQSPNGFSAYILGPAKKSNYDSYDVNMEVLQRENSVILLEEDYSTKYSDYDPSSPESEIFMQLMQNAFREQSLSFAESVSSSMSNGPFRKTWGVMQGNFCVLRRASMPAVLLEFGFMTNPDDLSTLRVEKNIDRIVENLFKAFSSYKEVYDASVSITPGVESEKAETSESAPKQEGTAFYGIQVLASSRELSPNDRFFKGQDVICVKSGKMYKYIICNSSDLSAVRKSYSSLKPNFPESFIVKVDGETISVQN